MCDCGPVKEAINQAGVYSLLKLTTSYSANMLGASEKTRVFLAKNSQGFWAESASIIFSPLISSLIMDAWPDWDHNLVEYVTSLILVETATYMVMKGNQKMTAGQAIYNGFILFLAKYGPDYLDEMLYMDD